MAAQIRPERLVEIARRAGLTVVDQPSQYKIHGRSEDRRFYIPKRKTWAVRVELSGWSHPRAIRWERAFPGKEPPSPFIEHVLDLDQPEDDVIRDFREMAEHLAGRG